MDNSVDAVDSPLIHWSDSKLTVLSGIEKRELEKTGWRRVVVDHIDTSAHKDYSLSRDCRKAQPLTPDANYAVVRYYHMHSWITGAFPVASGAGLKAGDEVYVNAWDCSLQPVKQNPGR